MRFSIRTATERDIDALNQIIGHVDALHREHLPHIFQQPDGPARDREYMLGVLADESCGFFVAEAQGPMHSDTPSQQPGQAKQRKFCIISATLYQKANQLQERFGGKSIRSPLLRKRGTMIGQPG